MTPVHLPLVKLRFVSSEPISPRCPLLVRILRAKMRSFSPEHRLRANQQIAAAARHI